MYLLIYLYLSPFSSSICSFSGPSSRDLDSLWVESFESIHKKIRSSIGSLYQ